MAEKTACIIGSTGLIGGHLVRLILSSDQYNKLIVISRRSLDQNDPKLEALIIEDFTTLEEQKSKLKVDDYFCALGTTMKKAGSKEAFLKVDVEFPLKFAEIAKENNGQVLMVSAQGANSSSMIFYNRAKGELEEKLKSLNLRSLKVFRPSLLLGDRDEFRPLEWLGEIISKIGSFFMFGSKKKFLAIEAEDVAKSMVRVALENENKTQAYSASEMVDIVYK